MHDSRLLSRDRVGVPSSCNASNTPAVQHLVGNGIAMDLTAKEFDPFSRESLWKLSRFSIEALQPLEGLPWDANLPGRQLAQMHDG